MLGSDDQNDIKAMDIEGLLKRTMAEREAGNGRN